MSSSVSFPAVVYGLWTLSLVAVDLVRLVALAARPRAAWVAENSWPCSRSGRSKQTRSCVGTAKDSASSGVGSLRRQAERACPTNLQGLIREMAADNPT